MFKELTNNKWQSAIMIYYNWNYNLLADKKKQYSSFVDSDYILSSNSPTLDDNDIKIIYNYRDNFITFLLHAATLIKQIDPTEKYLLRDIEKIVSTINAI